MTDPRPRLEVVSGGGPGPEATPEPPRAERGRSQTVVWLLLALLVLALAGLGVESRRAVRLEARVEGLSAQLAATEAALEAHRSHLDEVRGSVAALQDLLDRGPVSPESSRP